MGLDPVMSSDYGYAESELGKDADKVELIEPQLPGIPQIVPIHNILIQLHHCSDY